MNMKTTSILVPAAAILLLSAVDAHANCANLPGMRLTAKQNHLSLNDNAPICVTRNDDGTIDFNFRITIKNPVEVNAGAVRVKQKDQSNNPMVVISGTNESPSNKVTVNVTGAAQVGDDFAYLIEVDGIGTLDPTVRVVDNDDLWMIQATSLQEVADAWLLSPQEIAELSRMTDAK